MADQFESFEDLVKACGKDSYRLEVRNTDSDYAVIAPHGGRIEPDTDMIARTIAGADLKLYAFIGRLGKDEANLHITSTRFNEPEGDALVRSARVAVAIHGRKRGTGDADEIHMGGANLAARDAIATALTQAGFKTANAPPRLAGKEPGNICNRCTDKGVQLELTKPLRQHLKSDAKALQRFAHAIRAGLGLRG